jgi:uroporphyrinogen III methyltransferase/synthase
MSGKVFLVGAGPGDSGLLTIRALRVIEQAEVILFDQLVAEAIRAFFPDSAEKLFVGKEGGLHHVTQDETISLIVEKAQAGQSVVRLKGGDPYVFGRGGEEAEACAAAQIEFEVVPGVTAGIACLAYAGIPATHRDASASVAFITGNRRADRADLEIPTPVADTLVYYMGIKNLPNVVRALLESGRSPDTPVALIHRGTTPSQFTVTGTLESIVDVASDKGIKPPALIVVGAVVDYRESLRWFDKKPLFGLKVLITRPRHQARELREQLEEKGAQVVSIPAIEIQGLPDYAPLDKALGDLSAYDYLVFTSVNGVTAFFGRLFETGLDARSLGGVKTVCIGSRTARELEQFHVNCDLIPEKYVAESLLEVFPETLPGKKVLIPRALQARDVLPEGLRGRGATVDVVPVYRTVSPEKVEDAPDDIDIALFTSSSTVTHFFKRAKLSEGCKIASIGPITADTLRDHGHPVDIEAQEHTVPGLVRAIETHIENRGDPR